MKLKQTIGKKTLLLLMINAVMGTGIFFLPAAGAGLSGPASLISWAIMGIIAIIMSLCFAEFVSMFPKAGGIYEYTKKSFKGLPAFIVGWIAWIVANITIAMLIAGSLNYLLPAIGLYTKLFISICIILFFNFVNYKGIEQSTKLLIFFGVATIFSILIIIIPGVAHIDTNNFFPFFVFPVNSILITIYFISETFFGWETATYLSEEVKNPRRVIPKMMVLSTAMIALMSFALVFVALGAANWNIFAAQKAPMSYLASIFFNEDIARVVAVIIFIPLIGTVAGWVVSSPRLLYAMARDNVLPKSFSNVHSKNRTPHNAIIFQTIVTIAVTLVGFANYYTILSLLIPLVVIMYSAFLLSFIKLRLKMPHLKRYYKAPFGIWIPGAVIVFNGWMLATWLATSSGAASLFALNIFFILFGIPLYVIIKLQTDEKFTGRFYDSISFLWDYLFPLWYGKNETDKIISHARIKKNHKVLDFGCGTGITTLAAAKKANLVIAVDISGKQIEKAFRRIKKQGKTNVIFVKESELNFEKNSFDSITAVGVLEHMKDPQKSIEDLMYYLKPNGTFSFLSFGKSFTIPAPAFLTNKETVLSLFKNTKTEVNIKKYNKRFTDYWYIYGKKIR